MTSYQTVVFCFVAALCCLLAAHLPNVNSAARCATRLATKQNTRFGKKSNYVG